MCLFVWGVYRRFQYYSCTSASIVLWSWRAWSDPQRFPVFGWSLMNVAQCCWLLTTAGHLKRGRARQWTVKSRRRIGFLYWWKTPLNRKPTVSSVLFGRWLFLHGLNVDVFVMRFFQLLNGRGSRQELPSVLYHSLSPDDMDQCFVNVAHANYSVTLIKRINFLLIFAHSSYFPLIESLNLQWRNHFQGPGSSWTLEGVRCIINNSRRGR